VILISWILTIASYSILKYRYGLNNKYLLLFFIISIVVTSYAPYEKYRVEERISSALSSSSVPVEKHRIEDLSYYFFYNATTRLDSTRSSTVTFISYDIVFYLYLINILLGVLIIPYVSLRLRYTDEQ